MPGAVETLSALSTTIGAERKEEQKPIFEESSTLGAVNMVATAQWTAPLFAVGEKAKKALHRPRIITPGGPRGNSVTLARLCGDSLPDPKSAGSAKSPNRLHECPEVSQRPAWIHRNRALFVVERLERGQNTHRVVPKPAKTAVQRIVSPQEPQYRRAPDRQAVERQLQAQVVRRIP